MSAVCSAPLPSLASMPQKQLQFAPWNRSKQHSIAQHSKAEPRCTALCSAIASRSTKPRDPQRVPCAEHLQIYIFYIHLHSSTFYLSYFSISFHFIQFLYSPLHSTYHYLPTLPKGRNSASKSGFDPGHSARVAFTKHLGYEMMKPWQNLETSWENLETSWQNLETSWDCSCCSCVDLCSCEFLLASRLLGSVGSSHSFIFLHCAQPGVSSDLVWSPSPFRLIFMKNSPRRNQR